MTLPVPMTIVSASRAMQGILEQDVQQLIEQSREASNVKGLEKLRVNDGQEMMLKQAVMEAAKVRLRPILMTTAAMIAGLIPLMYASGAGAQQRFSIGIVIVAGLAIGTLFTLFVLPVIYSFIASEHKPLPEFEEKQA